MSRWSSTVKQSHQAKRLVVVVLGALVMLSSGLLVLAPMAFVPSFAQADIKDLNSKKNSIGQRASDLKRKRQQKEREAKAADRKYQQTQRQVDQKRKSLNYHKSMLNETRTNLSSLDQQLDNTIGERGRITQQVMTRLKNIYQGERVSMLTMLLEADDISGFIDRMYYKKRMIDHDKKMLADLKAKIDEFNSLKNQLAQQKESLAQNIQTIEVQEQQYRSLAQQNAALRNKLKNDVNYFLRAEKQLARESAQITNQIQALTKKDPKKTFTQSSCNISWPLRGRITSPYGYRYHPVHKRRRFHSGLDIAARAGTHIKSADGGQVIFAGWKGGYGKAVMINHGYCKGKNIVTLYGHMSAIHVRNGQSVNKGSHIGNVGSTGVATGPHLHFEVRVNGKTADPKHYL